MKSLWIVSACVLFAIVSAVTAGYRVGYDSAWADGVRLKPRCMQAEVKLDDWFWQISGDYPIFQAPNRHDLIIGIQGGMILGLKGNGDIVLGKDLTAYDVALWLKRHCKDAK